MRGLLLLITLTALLAGAHAFRRGSPQRVVPLGGPLEARRFQDVTAIQPRLVQELTRAKRHAAPELVRTQPHLVHDMGRPEIHDTSRSQTKVESANSSQSRVARTHDAVEENRGVQDEMERMVHLAVPQDSEDFRGPPDSTHPEMEHRGGPAGGDASLEGSGFFGTDTEDRDRGEDGGEDRERRGGEEEWERGETRGGDAREEEEEEEEPDVLKVNHTTPDLDALIGYSPSLQPPAAQQPDVSLPAGGLDSGPQEQRGAAVLEAAPTGKDLWEAEQDGAQSSGYGLLHSSITASPPSVSSSSSSSTPPPPLHTADAAGTATPETDTGTDFGLLGTYTRDEKEEEEAEREEEEEEEDEEAGLTHIAAFTQNPTVPEVGVAPSREPLQPSVEEEARRQRERLTEPGPRDESEEEEEPEEREEPGVRRMIPLTTGPFPTVDFSDSTWDWLEMTTPTPLQAQQQVQQVVCLDWSELAGRGYVVLNMTQNFNCEEFRVDQGVRLLRVLERVFARRMNSPEGSWMIYLSKPTHQQHQLLMNVASENGVIATKDVLDMLGEIRKCLNTLGVQNYSAASSCQPRPSKTRSDYGKLFVVLVIIGSICMVIITSGFIYICWQRRLPAAKTTFRAEELHFVENGCHDNPMLDVTGDGQPEMREKKPSTNGTAGGGEGGGEEGSRWQVFVNQAATEDDEEEQDTHL